MYYTSGSKFGTIPHIFIYEVVGEHHEVVSNTLFLPCHEDISKYYWPIFPTIYPRN
jgi:hypothetical protein